MRMYEVTFYGAFAPVIMFAETRMSIRRKYPGIVDKIYRIIII